MSQINFSLQAIRDPQLAIHAVSGAPVWVWSEDGSRILWANAAGVTFFNARDDAALAATTIGPADPHRRQVVQLAMRLPSSGALRLERLRGFGAALGGLMTCTCARLTLGDGTSGILIATSHPPAGRRPAFNERFRKLLAALPGPAVGFDPDGSLLDGNDAAKALPNFETAVSQIAAILPRDAAIHGETDLAAPFGKITPYRVGHGIESGTIVLMATDTVIKAERAVVSAEPAAPEPRVPVSTSSQDKSTGAPEKPADVPPFAAETRPPEKPDVVMPPVIPSSDSAQTHAVSPPAEVCDDAASPAASTGKTRPEESYGEATAVSQTVARDSVAAAATVFNDAAPTRRRHPLRFMWQMDADSRFSFGSDEFTRLIGTHTASAFGRLWSEIADVLGLDPEGRIARAVATRNTWSGIVVPWPVDGSGARLPVEMSGLPVYDSERNFAGYRGFGVCRDLEGLDRLAAQRRHDTLFGTQQSTTPPAVQPTQPAKEETARDGYATVVAEPASGNPPPVTETDRILETPINVVPLRPNGEQNTLSLTAGENNAFHEIARQLAARLQGETARAPSAEENPVPETKTIPAQHPDAADKAKVPPADEPAAIPAASDSAVADPVVSEPVISGTAVSEISAGLTPTTAWLQPNIVQPTAHTAQDAQLFDRLPVGVLIYRLDRLVYANPAFLSATGYENLHALTEAGGLDALYVEPGTGQGTGSDGTPVIISTARRTATNAHLHTITWDGENAHALIFAPPAADAAPGPSPAPAPEAAVSADRIQAEELATILETTAEGIVVFDGLARINSCNRSAEALFGINSRDIIGRSLIDLFAPESQRGILDYLESVKAAGAASLLDHGRDVLGRAGNGSPIPLSVTMGRTGPESPRYFAIFRDKAPAAQPAENEMLAARRAADRMASAKTDVLARISHEVRTPLNAIIGFAEVMMEERFGALGNERYVEYMKDIRASGERVISIINDMLDLSRIESGKLDLAFDNQELNPLIEQCVAALQPHANRERIIVRTSLAHSLPDIQADARVLRQIALNLIGSSIHLAKAGGQVIVSTAMADSGEVVLRVRDTGHGLNDNEIAAALAPFRTPTASDRLPSDNSTNLSLTKALVEANRARFNIKSGPNAGTLMEVVFSRTAAQAV
ncbi:MAG: PAS domain-containing protein [Bradyrhizobiaceae bacterium]|nr:MAG: PAS domain-containing protein [Bradyrhizobiaceae bacterium]